MLLYFFFKDGARIFTKGLRVVLKPSGKKGVSLIFFPDGFYWNFFPPSAEKHISVWKFSRSDFSEKKTDFVDPTPSSWPKNQISRRKKTDFSDTTPKKIRFPKKKFRPSLTTWKNSVCRVVNSLPLIFHKIVRAKNKQSSFSGSTHRNRHHCFIRNIPLVTRKIMLYKGLTYFPRP